MSDAMVIHYTVKGLPELMSKLETRRLVAAPVSRFFRSAGFRIQGRAQLNAPVDTGALKNSIGPEFDSASPMRWVRVGTNQQSAAPMEFGARPHFPPVRAITPWAQRHGIDPFALALSIARKGTKPHPFLKPALEESVGDIRALLSVMGREIESGAAI
jgi:hypothetical protein